MRSSNGPTEGTVFLISEPTLRTILHDVVPEGIELELSPGIEATTFVLHGGTSEIHDVVFNTLTERIGTACVRKGVVSAAGSLGEKLRRKGMTVSGAESCTGGLAAGFITAVSGSSDYYWGGFTTYANEAKVRLIGVDPEIIRRYGAVSKQCVEEMAVGTRRVSRTDIAFAISGVAGPGGGTDEKPVGTVWIGIETAEGTYSRSILFDGNRDGIRRKAAITSLLLCEIASEGLMSLDTAFTWEYIC